MFVVNRYRIYHTLFIQILKDHLLWILTKSLVNTGFGNTSGQLTIFEHQVLYYFHANKPEIP